MLSGDEIREITRSALAQANLNGKRVLVILPDGTRTAPIPHMFRLICNELRGKVTALDFLIALGTHKVMSQSQIETLVGVKPEEWSTTFAGVHVFNHEWEKPETFVTLGMIPAEEVSAVTDGMLSQPVEVRINRLATQYDHIIVCGPVFPHEVVGFSGGNKYFFPGIS